MIRSLRDVQMFLEDLQRIKATLEEMMGKVTTVTFEATTELEIPHNLNTIPDDVLVSPPSADARIYKGTTEWTNTAVYLEASAACTARIYFVVDSK